MKAFIKNTNTWLLERYPVTWNTKIVWVLAVSLFIHLIFYIVGVTSVISPTSLHNSDVTNNFFKNGTLLFGVIISILILVIWRINMFKKNSFKNFYPTTNKKMFLEFITYCVIIFISTSFYYSYILGVKTTVYNKYPYVEFKAEYTTINNAAMFFSHNIASYTFDEKCAPNLFSKLYCETKSGSITKQPYYQFLNYKYQFYTIKEKLILDENYRKPKHHIDYIFEGDSIRVYLKDSIVPIPEELVSVKPSYFNYPNRFYVESELSRRPNYSHTYDLELAESYHPLFDDNQVKQAQRNYELLQRNNQKEIKDLITTSFNIIEKYQIDNNLTADNWFNLIYFPNNF